jgi:uncharacterized protein
MLSNEILSKIRTFAYNNSEKNDIHGFTHVERVLKLSSEIGIALNANLPVIKIAALLHDVGRYLKKDDEVRNHAEISAEIAEDFFIKNNFNIVIEDVENILHCIRAHSFSNGLEPKTLEAKILSDTDKLDALGAIGLYRTIGFTILRNGGLDDVIEHLENKILKLKNQLYLDISKEIAKSREKIIIKFYKEIKEEK